MAKEKSSSLNSKNKMFKKFYFIYKVMSSQKQIDEAVYYNIYSELRAHTDSLAMTLLVGASGSFSTSCNLSEDPLTWLEDVLLADTNLQQLLLKYVEMVLQKYKPEDLIERYCTPSEEDTPSDEEGDEAELEDCEVETKGSSS